MTSAATILVADDDRGKDCYIVDDQTVHRTDGSGTRSPAGRIHSVTSEGVFVEMSSRIAREIAESQIVSTGQVYTQTYSTANRTVAAATVTAQTALTVSDGVGTNDGTIGAITADASVIAAVQELAAKIGSLVTAVNALAADDLDNRQTLNALIDDLQTAGIVS